MIHIRSSVRRASITASIGCGSGSETTPAARDEGIHARGARVDRLGARSGASPPPVPLSTLRAGSGERAGVVFVEWEGLDEMEEPARFRFLEDLLEDQLTLVDDSGNEYRALSSMTRPMYSAGDTRGMIGGTVPYDWVVLFHVAGEARSFGLLVENPEPREEEPKLIRVDLGTLDG